MPAVSQSPRVAVVIPAYRVSRHILDLLPYKKVPRDKIKLPDRSMKNAYDDQATLKKRKFVAEKY